MVKWIYQDDDVEEDVYVAACLLLFGRLSKNENDSIAPKIVATCSSSRWSTRVLSCDKNGQWTDRAPASRTLPLKHRSELSGVFVPPF